jgi:hypothetical protein
MRSTSDTTAAGSATFLPRMASGLRNRIARLVAVRPVIFFVSGRVAAAPPPAGRLRQIVQEDLEPWIAAGIEVPWPAGEWVSRQSDGHHPVAWVVDSVPVCFGWLTEGQTFRVGELGGTCTLPAAEFWIWDCVTPERLRGRGFYTDFLRALSAQLADRPVVIFCDARNEPSRRGILSSGFQPWVTITRTPLGTRVKYHLHNGWRISFAKDPSR